MTKRSTKSVTKTAAAILKIVDEAHSIRYRTLRPLLDKQFGRVISDEEFEAAFALNAKRFVRASGWIHIW